MVEEDSSNVVQVAAQSKETSPGLIRPHLDLVVVSTGDEEGLGAMKVDAPHRSIMLLKPVDESSHAIVPQLYSGRVEGDKYPWPVQESAPASKSHVAGPKI